MNKEHRAKLYLREGWEGHKEEFWDDYEIQCECGWKATKYHYLDQVGEYQVHFQKSKGE